MATDLAHLKILGQEYEKHRARFETFKGYVKEFITSGSVPSFTFVSESETEVRFAIAGQQYIIWHTLAFGGPNGTYYSHIDLSPIAENGKGNPQVASCLFMDGLGNIGAELGHGQWSYNNRDNCTAAFLWLMPACLEDLHNGNT